jgi:zinc protease
VVLAMIDAIKSEGITEVELEKARKLTLSSHFRGLTTMRGKASDIGSNWLMTRNLNFSSEYLEAIQEVTVEGLQRVARCYFTAENLTVTSLNPKGSISGFQVEEAAHGEVGEIQKFLLPKGLRLLIREDPRLPLVWMRAVFKAGLLAEDGQSNGISTLMSQVLLKGTGNRNAEQIAETIEAVGGSISSDSGNNSVGISVRVMRPDLELGLDVLSDVILNPVWPHKAVEREKEIQLAGLKAEEEEMTSVARNILRRSLYPGHPYGLRQLGTPESVLRLDGEALSEFHRRHIVGKNGVIAIFGDVKAAEVKALVEKYLGSLPEGEEALTLPPRPPRLEEAKTVEEFRDKHQAVIMVGFLGADFANPDRHILELIDEASSDLGSRFFIRIREEMGLAYYVGTSQMPGLSPGPFVFYLGTSPEKTMEVKAEFLLEIQNLANYGLTKAELARAKEKLIGQDQIRNQSNESLAYRTALDELYGIGYDDYLTIPERISAVTLEQVKSVAARYFRDTSGVIAIVRPSTTSPETE